MIERCFVSADRTVLIASTHRVYTTAEKMHTLDGRYDTVRVQETARGLARRAVLLDLEAAAARHGTILSAVMFGALAGAGVLPWSNVLCETVIAESGRGVAASLAGFRDTCGRVADANGQPSDATAATTRRGQVGADARRILHRAELPDRLQEEWGRRIARLPLSMQTTAAHGAARCHDYQDDAYGDSYLESLAGLSAAAGDDVAAGSTAAVALDEAARQLALWMCFEDVIRVADLKSRDSRYLRLRTEAQATPEQVVRVIEYLKPGVEEIAAVMPQRFGAWLLGKAADGGWLSRAQVGLHIRSSSLWGHLLLRLLARMRPWRRSSLRFVQEQEAMTAWLQALALVLPASPGFSAALASLPQVLKGYGETLMRGRHNYARLWATHVAPSLAEGTDLNESALRLKEALAAALDTPEATADQSAVGARAATPAINTIRWMKRPGRNA
ncbi:MAG: indolepyruvate oxidoreductase subunit beta family protein [Lautropia sp.]